VDGPLLYYPSKLLGAEGWDTLAVSYGFQTAMGEPFGAGLEALVLECWAAIGAALEAREYPRLALLGKSMGAGVVAYLCANRPELAAARAGYLTPALGTPFFDPFFEQTRQPAYLALGTLDRYYSGEALERLAGLRAFELELIEGADHSLDVPGDLSASMEATGRAIAGLMAFIQSSQ
jgi:pimeloyl-ACP methyl ester carboxylesterase